MTKALEGGQDFRRARKELTAALGADVVRSLHAPSRVRAVVGAAGVFAGIGANMLVLAHEPIGLVWWAAFLLQGFCIQHIGYLVHGLGVHRGLGRSRTSDRFGTVCGLLILTSYTRYRLVHWAHHHHTGAAWDEGYKDRLDTRWKRLLNLTAPGALLQFGQSPPQCSPAETHRMRRERLGVVLTAVTLLAASYRWPNAIGYGYLLPALVTLPLASNLRLLLRHADADQRSELHCATFFRTGLWTRLLFFWDAGDCHLAHHLFPGIPFYRMGRAVERLRPLLLARGVPERRSLLWLVHRWYFANLAHRTVWQ